MNEIDELLLMGAVDSALESSKNDKDIKLTITKKEEVEVPSKKDFAEKLRKEILRQKEATKDMPIEEKCDALLDLVDDVLTIFEEAVEQFKAAIEDRNRILEKQEKEIEANGKTGREKENG